MRRSSFVAIMCLLMVNFGRAAPPTSVVRAWFPVGVGNRWVYQHETLDAGARGLSDPVTEQWKTEETIDSVTDGPDGMIVVKHIRAFDHEMSKGSLADNDATKKLKPVERILIHQNCICREGDAFRDAEGDDTPSVCFPIAVGGTWGRSRAMSPTLEAVWHVLALNGDPFGIPEGQTYHAVADWGSGGERDIWYAKGIGMVQTNMAHHGSFWEDRSQLLSTTLAGQTRSYSLQTAKTVPWGNTIAVAQVGVISRATMGAPS